MSNMSDKDAIDNIRQQRAIKVAGRKSDSAVKKALAESEARKAAAAADKALRRHTVKSGDTLGAIAQAMLGNANRANEIFEANKDILDSPSAIQIGQELKIPAE